MPDKDTIEAAGVCLKAVKALLASLGPFWTLVYAVALFLLVRWYLKRRDAQADAGWHRTIAAKDDMIEQINEQNREYRVQVLVLGNAFSKEEAVAMVYRNRNSLDKTEAEPRTLKEKQ